ncbi:Ribosome-binding protein 1, putative [Babesia ovata]|uniref:Ribosome-binding protein 1, putative n=1 Tax=Babesia ovata TaxID=189622 RepID=A0A2H6KAY0_9APIC|nr:Ribosome-binding protein 1, putative [Babesia ovata]GBE60153.1 Ribosome-binding protein 1, putative [Babesia ovata]
MMAAKSVSFKTLKECLEFLEWLNNSNQDRLRGLVAKELAALLKSFYHNADQKQIIPALSRFLGHVSTFYKKLCKSAGGVYHGSKGPKDLTEALLDCVPKFLTAMYFLWYNVDRWFDALGGGKWKYNVPGMEGWSWWALRYGDWGGGLQKYLTSSDSTKYGVMPGGFDAKDLKEGWYYYSYGGYYYAEDMAADIKRILKKDRNMHNFYRDVFVTTIIASTGLEHVNTANAVGLVGVFCEIVNAEANKNSSGGQLIKQLDEDLRKQQEFRDRQINWDELKKHCAKLKKSLIDKLFVASYFNHTGQSPDIKNLNQTEFAKKTAQWFRSDLLKVRQNLRKSYRIDYTSSAVPLNFFATTFLFPHGFIFGKGQYGTLGDDRDVLKKDWPIVIKELEQDGRGLKRLVRILKGETSQTHGPGGSSDADEDSEDSDSEDDDADESGVATPAPGPRPSSSGTSGAGSGAGRGRGRGGRGRWSRGRQPGVRGPRGGGGGRGQAKMVKIVKTFRKGGRAGKGPDRSSEPQPSPGAVPTQTSASPGESVVNTGQDVAGHEDGDPEEDEGLPVRDDSDVETSSGPGVGETGGRGATDQPEAQKKKTLKEREDEVNRIHQEEQRRLQDEQRKMQDIYEERQRQWQEYQDSLTALEGYSVDALDGEVKPDNEYMYRQQQEERNSILMSSLDVSGDILPAPIPTPLPQFPPFHAGPTGKAIKAPESQIKYPSQNIMMDLEGRRLPYLKLKDPWSPPPPIQKTTSHPPQPTERFPTYLPKHNHAPQLQDSLISGSKITPDTIPNASIPVDPRVSVAFMPQSTGQAILDLKGTRRFSNVAPTFNTAGKRAPTLNKLPVTVQLDDESIRESLKFCGSTLTGSSEEEMTLCQVEKMDPPVPSVLFSGSPVPEPNLNSSHNPTAILPPPPGPRGADIKNSDTVGLQRIVSSISTPAQDKSIKAPHPPSPGVSLSTGGQFPAESASPSFDHNSKGDEGSQVGNDADSPAVSASQSLGSGVSRGRDGHVPSLAHDIRQPPIILTASGPNESFTSRRPTTQDAPPDGSIADGGDGATEGEPDSNLQDSYSTGEKRDVASNILAAKGIIVSGSDPNLILLPGKPRIPGATSPGKSGPPPDAEHTQSSVVPSSDAALTISGDPGGGNDHGDALQNPKSQAEKTTSSTSHATSPADKPFGADDAGSDSPTRKDQPGRVTPGDTIWLPGQAIHRGKGGKPVWDVLNMEQDWDQSGGSDEKGLKDSLLPTPAATSPTLVQQPDGAANANRSNSQIVQMQEPMELNSHRRPHDPSSTALSPSSLGPTGPSGKPSNQGADIHGSGENTLQPGDSSSVSRSRSTSVGSRGSQSSGDQGLRNHTSSSTTRQSTNALQFGRTLGRPVDLSVLSNEEEDDEASGRDDDSSVLSPPKSPSRSPGSSVISSKPDGQSPGSRGSDSTGLQPISPPKVLQTHSSDDSSTGHLSSGSKGPVSGVKPAAHRPSNTAHQIDRDNHTGQGLDKSVWDILAPTHDYDIVSGGDGVAARGKGAGGNSHVSQQQPPTADLVSQSVNGDQGPMHPSRPPFGSGGVPSGKVQPPTPVDHADPTHLSGDDISIPGVSPSSVHNSGGDPGLIGQPIADQMSEKGGKSRILNKGDVVKQWQNAQNYVNTSSTGTSAAGGGDLVHYIPSNIFESNGIPTVHPLMRHRTMVESTPLTEFSNFIRENNHDPKIKQSQKPITPAEVDTHSEVVIDELICPLYPPVLVTKKVPYTDASTPTPRTVREMLCWVSDLPYAPGYDDLKDYIESLFAKSKSIESLPDPISAIDIIASLFQTCWNTSSVLAGIGGYESIGLSKLHYERYGISLMYYATEPCTLLCQLLTYVYASYHQLSFLRTQCGRDSKQGGWRDCQYGEDVEGSEAYQCTEPPTNIVKSYHHGCNPSPLQGFLTGRSDLPTYWRTPRTTGELVSFFHHFGDLLHKDVPGGLSDMGSALSTPHDNCPKWDKLSHPDLQAIRTLRGSDTYASDHAETLSALICCGIDNSNCRQHLLPITYRAYALYSSSFVHDYLSWVVYLPDRLWESLGRLQKEMKKHDNVKCASLYNCPKAMPLLYSHGFTPPGRTLQSRLTCSQVINKLGDVVAGEPIANLMTAMDNFLYGIREPFFYTLVTLWSVAMAFLSHTVLYRMDVLRIRSHLLTTRASHLIDVKALLSKGRRMLSLYRDVDYFDDDLLTN